MFNAHVCPEAPQCETVTRMMCHDAVDPESYTAPAPAPVHSTVYPHDVAAEPVVRTSLYPRGDDSAPPAAHGYVHPHREAPSPKEVPDIATGPQKICEEVQEEVCPGKLRDDKKFLVSFSVQNNVLSFLWSKFSYLNGRLYFPSSTCGEVFAIFEAERHDM